MEIKNIANTFQKLDWRYFVSILGIVLLTRVILCIFKAYAIRHGNEADDKNGNRFFSKEYDLWKAFYHSFLSNAGHGNIDDYWIPFFIGLFELAMYPFIIAANDWKVIGGWLGIKTVVAWAKWHNSRTSYNRFLLGNLMVLLASIFLSIHFLLP